MKKFLFLGVFAFVFLLNTTSFNANSSVNNVSINPQPEPPGIYVVVF